jgi:Secretion system C-terminal sorting domain
MKKLILPLITGLLLSISVNNINAQTTCWYDSIYTYNASNLLVTKEYYFYNSNGWCNERIKKDSVNGNWLNSARYLYTYDSNGNYTDIVTQSWANNNWRNGSRELKTYNTNEDLLTHYSYYWDTVASSWVVASFQHDYFYNGNNKMTMHLQAYISNGVPTDSTRTTYTYDANWNEMTNLREGWTSSNPNWFNIQKWLSVYDVNNNLDSTYNLIWNTTNLTFDTSYLTLYTYDAQNNLTEYLNQQKVGAFWQNMYKQMYSFDANNNQTSYEYFYWDQMSNGWNLSNQTQNSFNSSNQYTSSISTSFNPQIGMLMNNYKSTYLYDTNDNLEFYIAENWDLNLANWVPSYKVHYFYQCGILGVNEAASTLVKCFPNPATEVLNIELNNESRIEIYSLSMSKMAESATSFNHSIDVSSFSPGMYFVKLENGQIERFTKE